MREYTGVKMYHFHFNGIIQPVIIEAKNLEIARSTLNKVWNSLAQFYRDSYVEGETIIVPVEGVTTKVEKGIEYTWVGYAKKRNGWQDTESLLKEAQDFTGTDKTYRIG